MNIDIKRTNKNIILYDYNINVEIIDKSYTNTHEVFSRIFICNIDNDLDSIIKNSLFDELQKEMIAEEYFSLRSDLRWNLYIVFLKQNEIDINHEQYSIVIRNDDFARKLILTKNELNEFLSDDFEHNDEVFEHDIISRWYNKLEENDLHGCLYNRNYKESVISFIADEKPIRPSGRTNKKNDNKYVKDSKYTVKHINALKLLDYRKHCFENIENIELSDVNVFIGTNGSGKTSTCDAIENALTGTNEDEGKIEIEVFNGSNNVKFSNSVSNEERRKRDYNWYNSMTNKNKVPIESHFRAVNYLRSNIAKQSNQGMEVSSFLSSIVFGTEFLIIKERISNFTNEFIRKNSNCKRQLSEYETELEKFEDINIVPFEFTVLKELLNQIKLIDIDDKSSTYVEDVLVAIATVRFEIQELIAFMKNNKLNYIKEIKVLQNDIETKINKLLDLKKENNVVKNKIKKKEDDIKDFETELRKYKSDKSLYNALIQQILHFSSRLHDVSVNSFIDEFNTMNNNKNNLDFLLKNFIKPAVNFDFDDSVSIDDLIKIKNKLIQELSDVNVKAEDVKTYLNDMEAAVTNIYSIINLSDTSTHNCPICGYDYANNKALTEAIDKTRKAKQGMNNQYNDLLSEKSKLSIEIEKTDEMINRIRLVNSTYTEIIKYKKGDESKATIKEKYNYICETILERDNMEDEIHDLQDLYNLLIDIKENHEALFNVDEYNKKNFIKIIQSYCTKCTEDIKKINKKIDGGNIEVAKLGKQINEIDNAELDNYEKTSYDVKVNKENIERIFAVLEEKSICSLAILDIDSLFRKLFEQIDRYNRWRENNAIVVKQEEIKNDLKIKIMDIKRQKKRCELAVKSFNEFENPVEILNKFVKNNAVFIEKIFRRIHQPKEFSDIEISNKGEISFRRVSAIDDRATHDNMSTGQAIALYTSILLTLFRTSINAPNILIFDEPVANLDDLHLLSLIDIIRDFAITGVQIIFTTANEDVAKIFRRKFSFMKEKFTEFNYIRHNAQPVKISKYTYLPNREEAIEVK